MSLSISYIWVFLHLYYSQSAIIDQDNMASGWTGSGNVAHSSNDVNCPNYPSTCLRLGGDIGSGVGYAWKTFSTAGYYDISYTIQARASGGAIMESWTYDNGDKDNFYGYWNPVCTAECTLIANTHPAWDDRSFFTIRFEIGSGTPSTVYVYLDDLEIRGTRYTPNPTRNPTMKPSNTPTATPIEPTVIPTQNPSNNPTDNPTMNPSIAPTASTNNPTITPSNNPTKNPSNPTIGPSNTPTLNPSFNPTTYPTFRPSSDPSISPSNLPTNSRGITLGASPVSSSKHATNIPTNYPTVNAGAGSGIPDEDGSYSKEIILLIVFGSMFALCIIAGLIFIIFYKRKQYQLQTETKLDSLQTNTKIEKTNKPETVPDASPYPTATDSGENNVFNYNMNTMPPLPPSEIQLEGIPKMKTINKNNEMDDGEDMYVNNNDHGVTRGGSIDVHDDMYLGNNHSMTTRGSITPKSP